MSVPTPAHITDAILNLIVEYGDARANVYWEVDIVADTLYLQIAKEIEAAQLPAPAIDRDELLSWLDRQQQPTKTGVPVTVCWAAAMEFVKWHIEPYLTPNPATEGADQ